MIKQTKALLGMTAALAVLAAAFTACSNESSSDSGGGTTSTDTSTTNASSQFSGYFMVDGKNYATLSLDDGKYTLSGAGGTDTGTYELARNARNVSSGTYTLTSATDSRTFTVTISNNTITLSPGTMQASGGGDNGCNVSFEGRTLSASVGTNELTGLSFNTRRHDTEEEKTHKKEGIEFTDTSFIKTRNNDDDSLFRKTTYKYSYNSTTKTFEISQESVMYGDTDSYVSGDAPAAYFTVWNQIPKNTPLGADYWKKQYASAIRSNKLEEAEVWKYFGEPNEKKYLYKIESDRSSITLTELTSENYSKLDGDDFIYSNSSDLSDRSECIICISHYLEFRQLDNHTAEGIYDDGSHLEYQYDKDDYSGFVSATYTITGKGTMNAVLTLTITAATEALGLSEYLNTPYTCKYYAGSDIWTLE